MATAQKGDFLIRRSSDSTFEVVDAITHELIAACSSVNDAVAWGSTRGVAVFQQVADNRGRAIGEPILLVPRGQHTRG